MTHLPHVHMIVPGGGLSALGCASAQVPAAGEGALTPVQERHARELAEAHAATELRFFNEDTALFERPAFTAFLKPLRRLKWVVYAKKPIANLHGSNRARLAVDGLRGM
jgi:Putative transposase